MQWRRYGYATRSRGLNGMDIRAIKKQTSDESQGEATRKFGTELTGNILNNQKNKVRVNNNRKRTFHEVNAESKEEESDKNNKHYFDEYEQPAKRFRYNLRSRQQRKESTEVLGQENQAKNQAKKVNKNQKKMEVDSDGEDSDEDIDLVFNKKTKKDKKSRIKVKNVKNVRNRKQFPVRRSLRLKNKRMKKLELELQSKSSISKKIEYIEYIVDENELECDRDISSQRAGDNDNDLFVIDYVSDIMKWYVECENSKDQKALIKNGYISSSFQVDLNESMRSILLNWLLNVHRRFKLLDRSLFLGIYIFDAYLSLVPIKREELQLIGCASMWIASKYHEIYAPEANDFAYISDYSFNIDALFAAEIKILCKLKFRFANIITPLHFTERYLQIATYPIYKKYKQRGTAKAINDSKLYTNLLKDLTYYFIELSLFDCKLISTQKPSIIAAAALCFAILSISLYSQWPEFLKTETKYSYRELKPVLKRLNELKVLSQQKNITSVAKKHPNIKKWLDKLNIDAVINNKDPN